MTRPLTPRAQEIRTATLAALQDADEFQGCHEALDYHALMLSVAHECLRRAARCRERDPVPFGKPPIPWFSIDVEGDGLQGTYSLAEMLAGNAEQEDLCAWLRCAEVNEVLRIGGGAAPITEIVRFL